jgi:hypothetical protein
MFQTKFVDKILTPYFYILSVSLVPVILPYFILCYNYQIICGQLDGECERSATNPQSIIRSPQYTTELNTDELHTY